MNKQPEELSAKQPTTEEQKISRQFSYGRIIIITILAFAVSGYLIYNSFEYETVKTIRWTGESIFWIFCALILIVLRHAGYMYRLRLITNKKFSWKQSFQIITLWEFSSAVTPSTVGGAAVAIYFMKKEKLSLGKSAATSMLTIFLDQLFLAIIPIIFLIILGADKMFAKDAMCRSMTALPGMGIFHNMQTIYFTGYFIFLAILLMLTYGLFINAKALKKFVVKIFSLPILKRWKEDAIHTGDDVILTSVELKNKDKRFWRNAFLSTMLSWCSFFLIAACVVMAFFDIEVQDIPVIFARQFPIWMMMLLPLTPGGIGIAEIAFSALMCDYIDPVLVGTFAVVWRMITYYPYLFGGAVILPRWVNRVYGK
ncbi:MAG: flippase-like domain-containing protein [Fimbriimonadaceae bacterium]|nr:flippase-like domain-containing protein [Chitinophagales bacterium]